MKIINSSAICFAALLSTAANAGLIVNSIDMEVRNSIGFTYNGGLTAGELENQFISGGDQVCSVSLDSIDRVGSRQNCSGPSRDFATRFTIDLVADASTTIQFGPDWGLGGAFYSDTASADFVGDSWWSYNWDSNSVFEVNINKGSSVINFIGWEGCCAGANSARFSNDDGENWQTLAVTPAVVPEPAGLILLGLGMLSISLTGRKKI